MTVFFTLTAVKVLVPLEGLVMIAALTDPEWALPINTFLLLVITWIGARNGKRVKEVKADVDDARIALSKQVDSAASAAASAAESAALSAVYISDAMRRERQEDLDAGRRKQDEQ